MKNRVIDFHVHVFPDRVAPLAIKNLCDSANAINYYDGTASGLIKNMEANGIELSICLPVITNPRHTIHINDYAIEINEKYKGKLISFGGMHPDYEDYKAEIDRLIDNNIKGIKLHPVYQHTYIDDLKYINILEYALSRNLIVSIHAGLDPGFPGDERAGACHLRNMIDILTERGVNTSKIILAHTGGLYEWDKVYEKLAGCNVYMDESMTLGIMENRSGEINKLCDNELFEKIIIKHGVDRILAGSDNPWTKSSDIIKNLNKINISDDDKEKILYRNAIKLLNLE
jgi:hypothetical protein